MTRKFAQARRQAFLEALRVTGNQTLAAEQARVSRSWVQSQRAGDPEFKAEVAGAVDAARTTFAAREADAQRGRLPRGWGFRNGIELVVRGTGGAALRDAAGAAPQGERKRRNRPQIARARLKQWTPRVEERFFAALTATCNVKAACAEVGLSAASAYNHRKRRPDFARAWDAAIEAGFTQIECALLEAAEAAFSGGVDFAVAPLRAMSVEQALQLLHMHKHAARGIGKAPGKRWRPPRTLDDPEIRAGILVKLAMVAGPDQLE